MNVVGLGKAGNTTSISGNRQGNIVIAGIRIDMNRVLEG